MYTVAMFEPSMIHVEEFETILDLANFMHKKNAEISFSPPRDGILGVHVGHGFIYVIFIGRAEREYISNIVREFDSIYLFLPSEKNLNKNYMLVETRSGKTVVVDDNGIMFYIDRIAERYKINDISKIVVPNLTFDEAHEIHMKYIYEFKIGEENAHNKNQM